MQNYFEDKPKNRKKTFAFIIILIIAFLLIWNTTKKGAGFENFFLNATNREKNSPSRKSTKVHSIFLEEIAKLNGHWAITVKDLKSEETYFFNENDSFSAASIFKLAVMWAVFDANLKGKLPIDETINSQLSAMITVSDNNSAVALAEKIGWANITNLMQDQKLGGFNLSSENPTVTAKSAMDLLERIYLKTAVSQTASTQMQDLLFAQKINDRIPKYLPPDVQIGHKTGEIDSFKHDAGIVIGKKSHYIFVFLSETPYPQSAPETIASLSKKIYDALEEN